MAPIGTKASRLQVSGTLARISPRKNSLPMAKVSRNDRHYSRTNRQDYLGRPRYSTIASNRSSGFAISNDISGVILPRTAEKGALRDKRMSTTVTNKMYENMQIAHY